MNSATVAFQDAIRRNTRIDRQLIDECLRGNRNAWAALVTRYERLVHSVARCLCPPEEVSSVFKQVWLELYERLPELRDVEALPAWLVTATRRHAKRDDLAAVEIIEREHAMELALEQLSEADRRLIDRELPANGIGPDSARCLEKLRKLLA